jgi:predicted CXXCH cytochrome family protein
MHMKKSLLVAAVLSIAVLLIVTSIFAGNKAADVIKMNNKAYTHTKGIPEFTHKKHVALYNAKCGDCHHDDKGKAIDNLKEGDNVQSCFECHKKPGRKPMGTDAPKLSPQQELEYHAEAMHTNCVGCHKEFKKANNTTKAPTACTKCHPAKTN